MSPFPIKFITDTELEVAFPAIKELRPHLEAKAFVDQISRQRLQGYQLVGIASGGIYPCLAGFRIAEFLAWGKVFYVDDLVTMEAFQGKGYAGVMLDWLIEHAMELQCKELHLDSGYQRNKAHKLYLSKGLELKSHHFAMQL